MSSSRSPPLRHLRTTFRLWRVVFLGAAAWTLLALCGAWEATAFSLGQPSGLSRRQASMALGTSLLWGGATLPASALDLNEKHRIKVFQEASPSVLSIGIAGIIRPTSGGEEAAKIPPRLLASGFAWDANHAVTSWGTVKDLRNPIVTMLDQDPKTGAEIRKDMRAAVVGGDPVLDIAVLWVEGGLKPLHRGASQDCVVGQDVLAVGNPFGLEHSLSKGIISGLARTMPGKTGRPISGAIQTDASINPGNNGGPLLNAEGQVIGMNSAILSSSSNNAGVGLAVPIESIERSVTSVITAGYVLQPTLGVTLASDLFSKELGVNGVMVREVAPQGPAHKAGVKPMKGGRFGDVIVGVDGKDINSISDFLTSINNRRPGEGVLLDVERAVDSADGISRLKVPVELGSRVF